jgi:hypothetical protein
MVEGLVGPSGVVGALVELHEPMKSRDSHDRHANDSANQAQEPG